MGQKKARLLDKKVIKEKKNLIVLIIILAIFALSVLTYSSMTGMHSKDTKSLELYQTVCFSADSSGKCDSDLSDSPVTKEDCCTNFNKCCN